MGRNSSETSDGPFNVVSGGQSGVDRAALDAAIAAGVPVGGWCPFRRQAEDGPIPPRYPLLETPSSEPAQRTEWNVRDSDGLLVLLLDAEPVGGTLLAFETARKLGRPSLSLKLSDPHPASIKKTLKWLRAEGVRALNIAGPRESESPGVGNAAREFLDQLFGLLAPDPPDETTER
jgi:hypothetical protein